MKYIYPLYFLIIAILTSNSLASEKLEVELFNNSSNIKLNWDQKLHLYENTIGYLSTCRHLDRVIGNDVPIEKENESLKLITQGKYLKLSFGINRPRFPMGNGIQEVENIYVGIGSDGSPNLITENRGEIQLYAKCRGHYAILNYSCDIVLSKLLDFEINQELCARIKL